MVFRLVILVNLALVAGAFFGYLWWRAEVVRLEGELAAVRQEAVTPSSVARRWKVQGIVRGVAADQRLVITHEEVPGLMGAMTMAFRPADPALVRELGAGDRVEFTFEESSDGYTVLALRPIRAR